VADETPTTDANAPEVWLHREGKTRIVRGEPDKVNARYLGFLPKGEFDERQKVLDERAQAKSKERDAQVKADEKAAKDLAAAQADAEKVAKAAAERNAAAAS